MTIVAKPIEMIAFFNKDGIPHPIRFRLESENEELRVIKIDKVIFISLEKTAGNKMYVYQCQTEMDGFYKRYELKYELASCRWLLWKI